MQGITDSEKWLLCSRATYGGVEQTRKARGLLDAPVRIAGKYDGCGL